MKTLIIAEAGVNHNGDFNTALQMIDIAKEAGADVVKFQTSLTSTSRFSQKAEYQKKATGSEESQLEMINKLRFSFEQHRKLKKYCENKGIIYLSTPFDFESIDFLNSMEIEFWKIPSGEIINIPYLIRIANTHKNIVMSTGISTMDEIKQAIGILEDNGAGEIRLLQCTTQYPTPYGEVNLKAMKTLKEAFGKEVGLSDHSMGIEVPIAAVALGAKVIEKHFTLDRNMPGPDQKASIEPKELKAMVHSIRHIELALGDGKKEPYQGELQNVVAARKSIVAKRNIQKGEVFSEENIVPRHAGNGLSPVHWNEVLGIAAKRNFIEDEMIEL